MKTQFVISGLFLMLLVSCGSTLKLSHTDAIIETIESKCYKDCVKENDCQSLDDVQDLPNCKKDCFNKCSQKVKRDF